MIVIGGINSAAVNSFVMQYSIANNTWVPVETYGGAKPASKRVYMYIAGIFLDQEAN